MDSCSSQLPILHYYIVICYYATVQCFPSIVEMRPAFVIAVLVLEENLIVRPLPSGRMPTKSESSVMY